MLTDPAPTDEMTFQPNATGQLPTVLFEAFAEQMVFNSHGEKIPLTANVSPSEARTLHRVVRHLRPTTSAEIGLAQGISAMAILKALADNNGEGTHHIMDPFQQEYGDAGLAMIARAGLDSRCRFHRKFAEEVIPSLPSLQFGFIDASHLFDLTMTEFVLIDKKLEIGGMLAFHDLWMPSLQKLTRYVLVNRSYEIVRTFNESGNRRPFSVKQRIRQGAGRLLRALPGSGTLFRQEVLQPWWTMDIANLVVLRKTAHDQRDWRFHARF